MKTIQNNQSVEKFLATVPNEQKRNDCFALIDLMKEITQEEPKMWGDRIVGFGSYHYEYDSKRQGDWCWTGFSPLQKTLTIYMSARPDDFSELAQNLGKHTMGTSCIYVIKLADVDFEVLKEILEKSVAKVKKIYL